MSFFFNDNAALTAVLLPSHLHSLDPGIPLKWLIVADRRELDVETGIQSEMGPSISDPCGRMLWLELQDYGDGTTPTSTYLYMHSAKMKKLLVDETKAQWGLGKKANSGRDRRLGLMSSQVRLFAELGRAPRRPGHANGACDSIWPGDNHR